jgi:hypothetical protein
MYLLNYVDKQVGEVDSLKIVHNFSFCFWLSLLISSSHVHKFLNVKFDDYAPCLYNVQNMNGEQTIWDKF